MLFLILILCCGWKRWAIKRGKEEEMSSKKGRFSKVYLPLFYGIITFEQCQVLKDIAQCRSSLASRCPDFGQLSMFALLSLARPT